jgi:hypothetical protein
MKSLLRGWLPLCLATSCLLAAVQPALAQRNPPPGGNNFGQPGGNNFGQPGGVQFGQPGGVQFGQSNPVTSGIGTGMIISGIGLIIAGLALTGGVVYLAIQGQKTSYAGGSRRRKRRRDEDD